jgi:hypothetical protein
LATIFIKINAGHILGSCFIRLSFPRHLTPSTQDPYTIISWTPGTLITQFKNLPDDINPYISESEFIFVDLSTYSNESIKTNIFKAASLRIALLIMKNIFDQQKLEHHLTQFLKIGRAYFQETQGLKFLEAVIKNGS